MPIQLTSNCCLASNASPADPHLGTLITFNKGPNTKNGIEPVAVRQQSLETVEGDSGSSTNTTSAAAKTLLQLAPRNPAVALTVHEHEAPFEVHGLMVISSARTVEVYRGSGEYVGTFQGEPWSASTSSLSSPASTAVTAAGGVGERPRPQEDSCLAGTAPLFRIQVDSAMLAGGPTRGIMIKFFIPKRPIAHQDKLTIQEIDIVETMLGTEQQQQQQSLSHQQQQQPPLQGNSVTPKPAPNQLSMSALGSSSQEGSIEQPVLSSSGSGIDLAKVRELMGDLRIDQLPPGARDLMQTMEQQSQLRQLSASASEPLGASSSAAYRFPPYNTKGSPEAPMAVTTSSHPPPPPTSTVSPRAPSLSPQEDMYCARRSSEQQQQPPYYYHQHRGSHSSIFSDSSVTSPLATGDPQQPVTREDLRMLESRIMHAIDRKLSQLEERIMAKLYARNRL